MLLSRAQFGSFGTGAGLLVIGALLLTAVSTVVAFRGWPGLREAGGSQHVVMSLQSAPASASAAGNQVVLGGADRARLARATPVSGVPEGVKPPVDRDGLAGTADDVVGALDKLIP